MKILAIETSCDDTCIALGECSSGKFKLISNLISSQTEIHQKWGGVYPSLARREHQRNITPLLQKCLEEVSLLKSKRKNADLPCPARRRKQLNQNLQKILGKEKILYERLKRFLKKYQKPKIDLIAVTIGPGLDPCLWTGVNFARALSFYWDMPIVGIDHIEAHIFATWLEPIGEKTKNKKQKIELPIVALIVSGGHTQLILIKELGRYKVLGETRDDAAGEAFDKIARILGLSYPGGPAIAEQATKYTKKYTKAELAEVQPPQVCGAYGKTCEPCGGSTSARSAGFFIKLPRPMIYSKDYDFSFSGLKTAVLYNYNKEAKQKRESKKYIEAMAHDSQQAIIDVLIKKTIKAAKSHSAKSILLGGGVAANKELRKQFQQKINKENLGFLFFVSDSSFCTDNAAMIASTACFKIAKGLTLDNWQSIEAKPNLRIKETN